MWISINDPDIFAFSELSRTFQDVTIEVDARREDGPRDNAFGVACRVSREHQYMFHISGNGFYRILLNQAEGEAIFLVE